jgi:hypothetical protein
MGPLPWGLRKKGTSAAPPRPPPPVHLLRPVARGSLVVHRIYSTVRIYSIRNSAQIPVRISSTQLCTKSWTETLPHRRGRWWSCWRGDATHRCEGPCIFGEEDGISLEKKMSQRISGKERKGGASQFFSDVPSDGGIARQRPWRWGARAEARGASGALVSFFREGRTSKGRSDSAQFRAGGLNIVGVLVSTGPKVMWHWNSMPWVNAMDKQTTELDGHNANAWFWG